MARPVALWLAWGLVVALALVLLSPVPALAWSARKPPQHTGTAKRPAAGAQPSRQRNPPGAPPASLQARCAEATDRAKPRAAELTAVLRDALAAREMACARAVVERLGAASAPLAILVDAAQLLGTDALALPLWTKAWQVVPAGSELVRQIGEGYADALLAAGDVATARSVVDSALRRTRVGSRRGLLDRRATIARLQGEVADVVEALGKLSDPDAQVVVAQLMAEEGRDDDAAGVLRQAWKRYPGHRALQAAWTQLLQRLGLREELRAVVDQVVRLAPADPLPYLSVLDAHVAARDARAARDLIDELIRRFPRHDVLIEALVDREQRMGDDRVRIRRLFDLLLAAGRDQPSYVEAYAEWLLGHGDSRGAQAVLARLGAKGDSALEGLVRQAQLLLGHHLVVEAQAVVGQAMALAPADPRVVRLRAQLADQQKKPEEAEQLWLGLTKLGSSPSVADRRRAADARQALLALYRRKDSGAQRLKALAGELAVGEPTLGLALLVLELAAQLDDVRSDRDEAFAALTDRLRGKLGPDPELLAAIAAAMLARDQDGPAVAALVELRKVDPDAALGLLQQTLDRALARGRRDLAEQIEAAMAQGAQSAAALLRQGELHLRYGDVAGATALFKRSAQSDGRDTRATAKLAELFRRAGQAEEEEAALRDIVMRSADADELETAGQRLITVALARGTSADLVRWLDAVAPQHPRREVLARFRSSAWDVWLRTAPLDAALGRGGRAPPPAGVTDSLGSGDLALQIRALREISVAHRSIAPALARTLLQHSNLVLRRDTALAMGGCGSASAAEVLRDVMSEGADRDEDVVTAQLLALARLPEVRGLDPVLVQLLNRGDPTLARLSQLVIGARGTPDTQFELMRGVQLPRRDNGAAALLALGAMVGRFAADPSLQPARAMLVDQVQRVGPGQADLLRSLAALWAIRASGLARTGQELARVAVEADNVALRRAAVILLALPQEPRIVLELPDVGDGDGLADVRERALRVVLAPILAVSSDELTTAMRATAAQLAPLVQRATSRRTDGARWRDQWCEGWRRTLNTQSLADSTDWLSLCGKTGEVGR